MCAREVANSEAIPDTECAAEIAAKDPMIARRSALTAIHSIDCVDEPRS